MNRLATFVIFGLLTFVVYFALQIVLPQEANWNDFYQSLLTRLDSERALSVFLLLVYLFLAAWVVLAFGRWMAQLAIEMSVWFKNILGKNQDAAAHQTLDNTLIIDNPKLKRPMVRFLETVFSVAVWIFFVYLFQTILSTFMWIFGMERIYNYNFSQATIDGTMDAILLTFFTAAFFLVVLVAWAQWNYWRFGRTERRKPGTGVDDSEVASYFCLPLTSVRQIQGAKITSILPLAEGFEFRELKAGE